MQIFYSDKDKFNKQWELRKKAIVNVMLWYYIDIKWRYEMDLSNFNLRGIAPEVMAHLKREAKKQHTGN